MSGNDQSIAPNSTSPDSIDLQSDQSMREWANKLDVTEAQLKEAVSAVGDRATDVEMHLKGSRSITNVDRTMQASGGDRA